MTVPAWMILLFVPVLLSELELLDKLPRLETRFAWQMHTRTLDLIRMLTSRRAIARIPSFACLSSSNPPSLGSSKWWTRKVGNLQRMTKKRLRLSLSIAVWLSIMPNCMTRFEDQNKSPKWPWKSSHIIIRVMTPSLAYSEEQDFHKLFLDLTSEKLVMWYFLNGKSRFGSSQSIE